MKLFVLFLLCGVPAAVSFSIADVLKLSEMVVVDLFHAWEILAPKEMGDNVPVLPFRMKEKRLMSRMIEISREVRGVDQRVRETSVVALYALSVDLPANLQFENKINSILDSVMDIEAAYHLFLSYLETGIGEEVNGTSEASSGLERYTLEDFARNALSHSPSSVRGVMDNLHYLIVKKSPSHRLLKRYGIFAEIKNLTEVKSNLCNLEQSQQQLLYNIYSIVQITQLKAYSMIQFSWMLLKLYNKGNFTLESEMMATKYRERVAQQADEINRSMVGAKTEMWRCDPKSHIYNETYTELVKLLQGFIVNEVDLNDQMSCKEDCGFYQKTKQYSCYKNNFCSKQPTCRGDIVDCGFVDSDMWICPAGKMSTRRYDYIEYENGRLLGEKKTCSRPVTKVDSWWRWLFWHCSYCFCLCDDPINSSTERYFNLQPIISDVQNNKVITGLRFVKINRVTYLQIQEGEMLPKGAINETTIAWKRLQTYDVKSYKVSENIDYFKMSWEQRAIDLDDLKTPPNHVLTGIRFRKVGRHLNFEIQGSEFDFETGKLLRSGERNQWISNDNTDGAPSGPRKKLELGSPGVSTKSPSASIPDSENDMYLEFVATNFGMDAAQSTVPFIDTQPVSPRPPIPLAGAGIYHKGYPGYGGFIAPKVYTLDLTPHLQNQFPEINEAWRRIQSK